MEKVFHSVKIHSVQPKIINNASTLDDFSTLKRIKPEVSQDSGGFFLHEIYYLSCPPSVSEEKFSLAFSFFLLFVLLLLAIFLTANYASYKLMQTLQR